MALPQVLPIPPILLFKLGKNLHFPLFLATITQMPTKHKHGFTLIEIIIVLAIISILVLLLITSLTKQRMRAIDARMKSDLERLRIAFEEYYNDNNCYPPLDWYNDSSDCDSENLKPYLNVLPCNPNTRQPYPLEYPVSQCSSFKLYTTLNDTNDSSLSKFCVTGGSTLGNYGVSSTNVVIGIDCSAIPSSTPSPSPSALPGFNYGIFGCQNNITCNDYGTIENVIAKCTYSFAENDCQNLCSNPIYWCN